MRLLFMRLNYSFRQQEDSSCILSRNKKNCSGRKLSFKEVNISQLLIITKLEKYLDKVSLVKFGTDSI